MAGILGTDLIVQVAFVVHDVEATAKKVGDFFGLEVPKATQTGPIEVTQAVYRGEPTHGGNRQIIFNFGQVALELIQPDEGPSAWREALDANGEGFHHLAFRVKDAPGKVKALKDKGYTEIMTGKWGGDHPGMYSYVDTSKDLKFIIELLESFK
jgi:catechol 2,3-dioxygenase-like lactoylglutathione lyase family enzyme